MATFPTPQSRYTPPLDAHRILLAEELAEIAERAQSFTSATGVIIALRRNSELVVRTSTGIAPEVGVCIPMPSGITGLCVTTKKPQTSASADAEAQLESVFRALSVRAVLSVPVQWDGDVRGVLVVLSQMPEAFNRTHVAILMTLRDVIANKLSQCELPSDSPRQAVPGAVQPVEISVDSLLKAPNPERTAPKLIATPSKASAVPAPRLISISSPRVETAAAEPAAKAEQDAPVAIPLPAQAPVKPLAELLKEPAEAPVAMSPDVLCPGDDPTRYGAVQKPRPVACTPPSVDFSPTLFAAYHPPAKHHRNKILVFATYATAIVVLGLAIALYARHTAVGATATASVAAPEAAMPAPAPSLVAVPLPKSFGEHPPAAEPSKPAAATTIAANHEEPKRLAEPKPAQPKTAAEAAVQESAPVLHVAPAKPLAKSEGPIEPPALSLMTASNKLPDLGSAAVPAVSLAARKSALVPATLVQGKPPQYPSTARPLRLFGTVKLQVSISAEGKVTNIRALSGAPLLREASITAVRNWVYRPAYLGGTPVSSEAEVSLQFSPYK